MKENITILDDKFSINHDHLFDDYQESLQRRIGERLKIEDGRLSDSGSTFFTEPDKLGYGYNLIDSIVQETGLCNYDRGTYKYITFTKETFLGIHKDKHSPCWLGIVVKGQQPIYTYDESHHYDVPGGCNGKVTYNIALINGNGWHCVPVYRTGIERVLLRVFFNVDYHTAVDTIENGYKGDMRESKILMRGSRMYKKHPRMVSWYE